MYVDVVGKVNNTRLPVTKPLLPILECIINSIQGIEDSRRSDGLVEVILLRESPQVEMDETGLSPVTSVIVNDNGIGFNEVNFQSFGMAESTFKIGRGGKGVGRFLWLKSFDDVEVNSIFDDASGRRKRRSFKFRLTPDGVSNVTEDSADGQELRTSVRLNGIKPDYARNLVKKGSTIAEKILEHCLVYLLRPSCPRILIHDGNDEIDLKREFEASIKPKIAESRFNIGKESFTVRYVPIKSNHEQSNLVILCADSREVETEPAHRVVPELCRKLISDSGESIFYEIYVSSPYFDRIVNTERTALHFVGSQLELTSEGPSKRDFEAALKQNTESILSSALASVREENDERIRTFVTYVAPQYRPLLHDSMRERIRTIGPDLSDTQLDVALHTIKGNVALETRQAAKSIIEAAGGSPDQEEATLRSLMDKLDVVVQSDLAEYVVHRKVVLDILEKSLQAKTPGKYEKEEVVHGIIFPLKKTSEEVDYERQHLWIIDERLSYHKYLTSDKPLTSVPEVGSSSRRRPDLLIAFGDSADRPNSIVLIEFKRPMREGMKDEDNPIQQLYDYVQDIKDGKVNDKEGRPVNPHSGIPFYCYLICDLTPEVHKFCKGAGLLKTPDEQGYFGYSSNYGCYIEVLSFDKILSDAQKRNRILFDKLGIA